VVLHIPHNYSGQDYNSNVRQRKSLLLNCVSLFQGCGVDVLVSEFTHSSGYSWGYNNIH